MKLSPFGLLFTLALSLSAQVTTDDVIINRLDSALQSIGAEKSNQEISVVIAVQANNKIQPEILRNFRKIASMIEPLVSSGRGEVEVLSYGDRVRVLVAQPFTSDSSKAAQAMAYLKISMGLQSSSSNVLDAIAQATADLAARPSIRRQAVIVIGESSKDKESERTLKDFMDHAGDRFPNVVFRISLVP